MNTYKNIILPLAISALFVGGASAETAVSEATGEAKKDTQSTWRETKETSNEAWHAVKDGTQKVWASTKDAFNEGVLAGKLETAIMLNKYLNPFAIDIEVEGDKAILDGTVSSPIEKDLAGAIAEGIEGINSVENNITVKAGSELQVDEKSVQRTFAQYVEDATTTAYIKSELLANKNIQGLAINVDTYKDQVTLTGEVKTEEQKLLAEAIVKKHEDVAKVVNRLRVDS